MKRRFGLLITAILSICSLPLAKIDTARKHEKPKGRAKISRNKEWKNNLQRMNQRQRGLRSPIGRGK